MVHIRLGSGLANLSQEKYFFLPGKKKNSIFRDDEKSTQLRGKKKLSVKHLQKKDVLGTKRHRFKSKNKNQQVLWLSG